MDDDETHATKQLNNVTKQKSAALCSVSVCSCYLMTFHFYIERLNCMYGSSIDLKDLSITENVKSHILWIK